MKRNRLTKLLKTFKDSRFRCSRKAAQNVYKSAAEDGFERCVICGAATPIPTSMPIDWRDHYEIGCGQICMECAKKIEAETAQNEVLSYEQIELAVEQCKKHHTAP